MKPYGWRKFGWKKDKFDKRDYIHKRTLARIPRVVDLAASLPPVRDQGNIGACVGFAIASDLGATAKELGAFKEIFSPTWIYNGARFIEGTLRSDEGAEPKNALDWLRTKGGLLEHFWPYDPIKLDTTSPPSKFNIEAAKWPLLEYYRITGGIASICDAIASGHYVLLGIPWYDKWMDISQNGVLPDLFGEEAIGGHEIIIHGYNQETRYLLGMNSWGTGWGSVGFFTMPFQAFDYFSADGGYDAHYIRVNWNIPANPKNLIIKTAVE
jgi:hypothetical protein